MSFHPARVTELSVFMSGDRVGTPYNAEPDSLPGDMEIPEAYI